MGKTGMVTGCSSGKVLVWNDQLEITASFSVNTLGPMALEVRALSYDHLSSKFLVGIVSGEVFEMDATDGRNVHAGGALICSHSKPRICGLACHPYRADLVCTVGDDQTVRVFDLSLKRQVKMCTMDSKAYSCRYTTDGQAIVIGIGTGIKGSYEAKEGCHVLINAEDLTILHEARDTKTCLNEIRFSPDGEMIAMAGYDGNIYLYHRKKMDAYAICRGHTGQVLHVDFSTTGSFLMSNSSEGNVVL
jgi:microtubule-associated protein-like 6